MSKKLFRADLFYRLNVIPICLPPLRERVQDILPLTQFFVAKFAARLNKNIDSIPDEVVAVLKTHDWPGNIRELENAVRKTVALGAENLAMPELVAERVEVRAEAVEARSYSLKGAARAASREAEREMILEALARTRWNRKRAAQELQISYKSLLYKLKQIGLPGSGTE